mmetsp:Transcript_102278/g.295904  ORF Transcript_102278/g.295904 Transcript_102278/m.295904 type:complete len:84 (+) Transcript_102278:92-343(+)|eukprot:CAMPEP_0176012906 /NCGR_PEP_ID=MMETSP0120_2-20121206/6035_1 /TAXON_ID=160619 /ORGANISM="Kryptoperidinium foliaceum, Strain CCMP 1326" /LENGTH=83 /DNA_ID=CAMNT_0017345803 /DNA_START=76 /DNA_END=327 /DNA_ORIENTATION=+
MSCGRRCERKVAELRAPLPPLDVHMPRSTPVPKLSAIVDVTTRLELVLAWVAAGVCCGISEKSLALWTLTTTPNLATTEELMR